MTQILTALLKRRKEKKLSQAQTAQRAKISQAQLSHFEHGSEVYLSTAEHIAIALDMRLIAVPKEIMPQIEALLRSNSQHLEEEPSLLDKYNIKDED